jgi:hypothetical protein
MSVVPFSRPALRHPSLSMSRWRHIVTDISSGITSYLDKRRNGLLSAMPVGAALCFTIGAGAVAAPLGWVVAGISLLVLEVRFTPEDGR